MNGSMKQLTRLLMTLMALTWLCLGAQAAPPKILTIVVQGSGTVTLDPPGGSYSRGTPVTMTAIPAQGWNFDHWSGPTVDGSTNNPQVILMYNNYTVTATFVVVWPACNLKDCATTAA